jgi:hypothetical protein
MDLIFLMMERIHGISTELAAENGISLSGRFGEIQWALGKAKFIVGQNPVLTLLWVLNFIVWEWRAK